MNEYMPTENKHTPTDDKKKDQREPRGRPKKNRP